MPGPVLQVFKIHPDAQLPFRALPESIGYDISAYLKTQEDRPSTKMLAAQSTTTLSCGLVVLAPPGYCLLVCSRSGLAMRGVFVANAPGIIDPDYVGELKVLLCNTSWEPIHVRHEDRIAQLLVIPRPLTPSVEEIGLLPETNRGAKGFGSTGI